MIRILQDDDQAQWRALWAQYLDFDGSTLEAIVHDRTWARLLDEAEPMHGALALAGDEAVGLVHCIFHRSTWSLSDPATCRTCLSRRQCAVKVTAGH